MFSRGRQGHRPTQDFDPNASRGPIVASGSGVPPKHPRKVLVRTDVLVELLETRLKGDWYPGDEQRDSVLTDEAVADLEADIRAANAAR